MRLAHVMVKPEMADMRPAKEFFARTLPPGHPAREILSEPDELPKEVALAKLETYIRLALSFSKDGGR